MRSVRMRLPKRIATLLESWPEVYLSPISNSYYNVPHGMINTSGAIRVSDHWNLGNGDLFKTDRTVNNGYWTAARYNGAEWKVIMSLSPRKNMRTIRNDALNIMK